jgi:transposase
LHRQHFDDPALQAAYEASLETAELTLDRRNRLDSKITDLAATGRYAPVVRSLMCLRGISVLTAVGLAVEIGDWNRFTGNTIGAYLGLVPSEHSSGASRSQGGITKTGNTHARAPAGRGSLAPPPALHPCQPGHALPLGPRR